MIGVPIVKLSNCLVDGGEGQVGNFLPEPAVIPAVFQTHLLLGNLDGAGVPRNGADLLGQNKKGQRLVWSDIVARMSPRILQEIIDDR